MSSLLERTVLAALAAGIGAALGAAPVAAQVTDPLAGPVLSAEAEAMLDAHNRWRSRHQAPPLSWSVELARYAQAWAENLAANHPGLLRHSEGSYGVLPEAEQLGYGGWGENLSWMGPLEWSDGRTEVRTDVWPGDVVDRWAEEVVWYDFTTTGCAPEADPGCGHFTQVVWRSTTHVGCGHAVGADKAQVWACSYDPPGNWTGEYRANVLPPVQR